MSCTRFAYPARIVLFAALLALIALGPTPASLSAQPAGGFVEVTNVMRMESDDSITVMAEIVLTGGGGLFADIGSIRFHVAHVGTPPVRTRSIGRAIVGPQRL